MTQILILSQKVCLISQRGPTPVCRPGICSLGVFKPLNIQTMHFTKVQISEIIRILPPQADLSRSYAVRYWQKFGDRYEIMCGVVIRKAPHLENAIKIIPHLRLKHI